MIKSKITLFYSIAVFMAVICFSGLTFGAEVIVDNGGTGTSSTARMWKKSSGAYFYGTLSEHSNEAGASYTYEASVSGDQLVSLRWTYLSTRCTSVQVDIYDGNTLLGTVIVNHQADAGQWNMQGTYNFSGTASVVINSQGGCTTCADAVKFSAPSTPPQAVEYLHSWSQILPAAERFELVLDGAAVLDKETGACLGAVTEYRHRGMDKCLWGLLR